MMHKRFLSPEEFAEARALLKDRGINAGDLCRMLGYGTDQSARWSQLGATRETALAINAIIYGLQPWKPKESADEKNL